MTNETRKPTRCCLTETILKKFFPALEEPGATNDEPGYTETFLGTIMTYPDGDATLIVDPGAWIELPEGTVVTSHDRPEEIAEIIDTLIINAIQQKADREQVKRRRARNDFWNLARMTARSLGTEIDIYETTTGDADPTGDGREAPWFGWTIYNTDHEPFPAFPVPPIDFRDTNATRSLMAQLRLWLKQTTTHEQTEK